MEQPLIDDTIRELMQRFATSSPEEIALKAGKHPELPIPFVAQQIKGRAKIRKKLPSWHANPEVAFSSSLALEQCSSERTARYKAGLIEPGRVGVDLTSGFAVDARFFGERFEAFRCFEIDPELARVAAWNFQCFGLYEKVSVTCGDGVELLDTIEGQIDFAFIDPVRRDERSLRVSAFEECKPNIIEIWERLLARAKIVMVKASPGLDISAGLRTLPGVFAVHVVAVENECKETLFLAKRDYVGDPLIHAVNLREPAPTQELTFTLSEETGAGTQTGIPTEYLYEPNAAIMKAGGFKCLCQRYEVRALNPRTRLFCAPRLVRDFPGRIFRINGVGSLNTNDAKRMFPEGKANVIARNCGMGAEELRKKLKLKSGGELFAIGAAVSDVGRQLFCCEAIHQNIS